MNKTGETTTATDGCIINKTVITAGLAVRSISFFAPDAMAVPDIAQHARRPREQHTADRAIPAKARTVQGAAALLWSHHALAQYRTARIA
eukprot:1608719-Rhodomonas_salina.2